MITREELHRSMISGNAKSADLYKKQIEDKIRLMSYDDFVNGYFKIEIPPLAELYKEVGDFVTEHGYMCETYREQGDFVKGLIIKW